MKLYPYQDKAVSSAIDNLFERHNTLIVAATGAGKTIMMADSIKRFTVGFKAIQGRYPHTLCLAHRTEIHAQNKSKFERVCPNIPTSEISAERKSTHGLVHFGMVQTVVNIIEKLPAFDLIVIDETHHAVAETYTKIINSNKAKKNNMFLLGVTATPNRGDELPLIELFDNFYQITSKFLIDSHYLVRPKFVNCSPKFGDEVGKLAKNLKGNLESAIDEMLDRYLQIKEQSKAVIFAPSHEFCMAIKRLLEQRDRKPAYLYRGIDAVSRDNELKRFENGEAEEIINVDILTEGYDYPNIRNVVDFDTNGSESQWLQKVGRGLRTFPGKKQCTVIDFGGNVNLYPDCEVEVNLQGEVKKKLGEHLEKSDFFMVRGKKDKKQIEPEFDDHKEFKPYNPPKMFETINDEEHGIVYVCCSPRADAVIVNKDGRYVCYITDKEKIRLCCGTYCDENDGSFDYVVKDAMSSIRSFYTCQQNREHDFFESDPPAGEISKMQLRRLACKYPTTTLNFYEANCFLCYDTWRAEIWK
jgi:superfamily II DNA or RNA helicase